MVTGCYTLTRQIVLILPKTTPTKPTRFEFQAVVGRGGLNVEKRKSSPYNRFTEAGPAC